MAFESFFIEGSALQDANIDKCEKIYLYDSLGQPVEAEFIF